jgi:hypothetical protein
MLIAVSPIAWQLANGPVSLRIGSHRNFASAQTSTQVPLQLPLPLPPPPTQFVVHGGKNVHELFVSSGIVQLLP